MNPILFCSGKTNTKYIIKQIRKIKFSVKQIFFHNLTQYKNQKKNIIQKNLKNILKSTKLNKAQYLHQYGNLGDEFFDP